MKSLRIRVDLAAQTLECHRGRGVIAKYLVSTALNGPGQRQGSECTPLGAHVVRAKIGAGLPAGSVLVGRRPTGEIFSAALRQSDPQRDWILSRILWLGGLEDGRNLAGEVDTMQRYIYIHGAPDDVEMGTAGSHGCVRMSNTDIIELFEQVRVGTRVDIVTGDSR